MLFNSYFGKPKERPPQPPWLKWLFGLAAVYMLLQGLTKGKLPGEMTPVQKSIDQAEKSLTEHKIIDFETYKDRIFPNYKAKLLFKDIALGEGAAVFCGQTISISYQAYRENGTPIKDNATKAKPLTFRLGENKVMPVFEKGLNGMRVGGKRRIVVPASMSYSATGFKGQDILSTEQVSFDVELLSTTPTVSDNSLKAFRIAEIKTLYGAPIECGDDAHINLIIWDVAGKQLYSTNITATKEPANKDETTAPQTPPALPDGIHFTPGKSQVFFGLEQGVIGMSPGSVRTLVVPPAMQKTLNGKPPAIDFPLPDNQTVLVDVEYLP